MELHTYTGKVVREITRNHSLPKVASSIEASPELFYDRKQKQDKLLKLYIGLAFSGMLPT